MKSDVQRSFFHRFFSDVWSMAALAVACTFAAILELTQSRVLAIISFVVLAVSLLVILWRTILSIKRMAKEQHDPEDPTVIR